jgi:hypothetical protein
VPKDRSLVRASDIGAWTFCHRAWWLARVQEVPHRNPAQLTRGHTLHARHGEQTERTRQFHLLGRLLIALGVCVLLAALAWMMLAQ